jgi:hypothetical protein
VVTSCFPVEMFITGVIYGFKSYASCAELSLQNCRDH